MLTQAISAKKRTYENIIEILRRDDQSPHKFLSDKIKAAVQEDSLYRKEVR